MVYKAPVCGIVGIFSNRPVDVDQLSIARDTLTHRGPDASGTWVSESGMVGFGHRRLSILDLSAAGTQPFVTPDRALAITYNGEVYNFAELRRELEGYGCKFRTRTDTEVVLYAYQHWGADCVRKLSGMFAFAIWDDRKQVLFLARDRLGIKPLYYYFDGKNFVFASELKAIEAFSGLDLSVDETALIDFLTYTYVPAPKTPYKRVRKLPPAHTLSLKDGQIEKLCYWDVEFDGTAGPKTERHAVDGTRELLSEAVRLHLVADVPVGCLLSGGVDSSGVTAIAQRFAQSPIRTFSIGFDVEAHSETKFARLVATSLNTEHTEEIVSVADAKKMLGRLPGIYDEPFGDSSSIPTLVVCEVARRSVTVALSGDGGDEVFGGYNWYERHRRKAKYNAVPNVIREHLPSILEALPLMALPKVPGFVDAVRSEIERHVVMMGGFSKAQKRLVLTPEFARRYRDYDDYWYFKEHWRPELPLISRLQYLDLKTYLPDDILCKVDRASMAVGLELRPPLLDHRLVEFVASVPASIRVPAGKLKHLLKGALESLVPPEVINRPKKGFSVPMSHWASELQLPSSASDWKGTVHQGWLTFTLAEWERRHRSPTQGRTIRPSFSSWMP